MLRTRRSGRRAPRGAIPCGGNGGRPLRLFVSLALAAGLSACAISANEKQQALDGYAKRWSGVLQEGLVKETATSVAPIPGYAPGDVFTSYADGPDRAGCSVPRDLIRPDVHFSMSPSPTGGAAGVRMTRNEAIDVTFDDARETDVSPSQFLQWLAGDAECRKAVNAMLGSGPVKLVLGVVSAKATYNRMPWGDVSPGGSSHDLVPGGSRTDSSPRQYFLILYTVTRPIPPPRVRLASPARRSGRPVAENRPQAPAPEAKGDSGPVTAEAAPGAAPVEAAAPPVLSAGQAAAAQSTSLDVTLPAAQEESRIPSPGTSTGAVFTADPAGAIPAGATKESGARSCEDQFNQAQMLFGYSHFGRAAEAYESAYQCAPTGEHAPLALLNLAYSDDALNRMPDMCAAIAVLDRNFHDVASSIIEKAGELARIGNCR